MTQLHSRALHGEIDIAHQLCVCTPLSATYLRLNSYRHSGLPCAQNVTWSVQKGVQAER